MVVPQSCASGKDSVAWAGEVPAAAEAVEVARCAAIAFAAFSAARLLHCCTFVSVEPFFGRVCPSRYASAVL